MNVFYAWIRLHESGHCGFHYGQHVRRQSKCHKFLAGDWQHYKSDQLLCMSLHVARKEGQEIVNHGYRRNIKKHIIEVKEKIVRIRTRCGVVGRPRCHIPVFWLGHTTRLVHHSRLLCSLFPGLHFKNRSFMNTNTNALLFKCTHRKISTCKQTRAQNQTGEDGALKQQCYSLWHTNTSEQFKQEAQTAFIVVFF